MRFRPSPDVDGPPLRLNLGETGQPLTLRGTTSTASNASKPTASSSPEDGSASRSIRATRWLGAERGAKLTLRLHVAGRSAPLTVAGGAEIAGPRPRIVAVGLAAARLRHPPQDRRTPAQSFASFGMRVTHAAPTASVSLTCAESALRLGTVSGARRRAVGAGAAPPGLRRVLFLSFDRARWAGPAARFWGR
ncbi:MAG: hypothetical protein IPM24_16850 [Bryobacterales bacterium]|nr:hypothetical protein [Bryobacterales bacterium]